MLKISEIFTKNSKEKIFAILTDIKIILTFIQWKDPSKIQHFLKCFILFIYSHFLIS